MVEVKIADKAYTLFKQIDVTRDMDNVSGESRMLVSEQHNNSSFAVMQDLIEIFFDGVLVIKGYLEKISDNESVGTHDISYRIRDIVTDVFDSTVPDALKSISGVTEFSKLIQIAIDGLNLTGEINVIDEIGVRFNADDIVASEIGMTNLDYLSEYARKAQVFMNTDGKGNILIRRDFNKLNTILANVLGFNRNNIKDSNIEIDYSNRFNKYIVRSNGAFSSEGKDSENINNFGEAFDNEIRKTRVFEKIAESPMTSAECKAAAEEEANIRRMRAFKYSVTVAGFTANNQLWDIGKLVQVNDPGKGVIGEFLIKSVQWSFSAAGEITTMQLTFPDAYKVEAEPSQVVDKTTKASVTYTVKKGDNLSVIGARYGLTWQQMAKANPQIENPSLIYPRQVIIIPVEED